MSAINHQIQETKCFYVEGIQTIERLYTKFSLEYAHSKYLTMVVYQHRMIH